jgi:hypothetical protein
MTGVIAIATPLERALTGSRVRTDLPWLQEQANAIEDVTDAPTRECSDLFDQIAFVYCVDLGHIDDALLGQIDFSHVQKDIARCVCTLEVGRDRTHHDGVDTTVVKEVILDHNVRM